MIIVIRSLLLSLIILFIIGFQKAFLYTYIHTCVSVIIFGYVRIQNTYIHTYTKYIHTKSVCKSVQQQTNRTP